jgi:hypothetical protein
MERCPSFAFFSGLGPTMKDAVTTNLNHPNYAPPGPGDGNTDIFDATGTPLAPSASNPGGTARVLVRTTIPERQIQFAIKATF